MHVLHCLRISFPLYILRGMYAFACIIPPHSQTIFHVVYFILATWSEPRCVQKFIWYSFIDNFVSNYRFVNKQNFGSFSNRQKIIQQNIHQMKQKRSPQSVLNENKLYINKLSIMNLIRFNRWLNWKEFRENLLNFPCMYANCVWNMSP